MIARRARSLATVALLLAATGCGGDERTATVAPTAPRTVTATTGPQTPPARYAPLADGRRVFDRSGCLACHQLGSRGNSGPGNNLTGIGERRSAAELQRALLDARAPMPSYGDLPRESLRDLVVFLSALRGDTAGGLPCPGESDCG